MHKLIAYNLILISVLACETPQKLANKDNVQDEDVMLDSTLIWGAKDTTLSNFDNTGDGIFGRKIIYRDLSGTRAAVTFSGRIVTMVCINNEGIVTYAEIIKSETTIQDIQILKLYLKAARGYKYQPDLTAPKEQCGKLSFRTYSFNNNSLK